ncbi:MAG: BlaI/MecI/CopY family transcriptional regulator [Lachnospiraceae bacterium]|nr:BlaI/MecI/CopY family transcriptional regulator [Lachnospiraceae bacterium]MDE6699245.1 BlaI/MecI/CopY family transcriptional regulator [Lachnospiraceae bacterium]
MGELTPSENEWTIMEVVWRSKERITATKIIEELSGVLDISKKTVRVMINRLVSKGLLDYVVDENDARVYHYFPKRSKEECLKMKSERFINNYFGGDRSLAVANFLKASDITEEQIDELRSILDTLEDSKHKHL